MSEVTASADAIAIGVAQFAPSPNAVENLTTVSVLAKAAVARGAKLVVFPEYSSYFQKTLGQDFVDGAEPLDGPFIRGIRALATELDVHLVIGLVERIDEPSRFSNTLVAVSSRGDILSTYRKLHLYDAFGSTESEWVKAGDIEPPQLFRWEGFTVGLQTCYDLRFPEVTRRLVDAGADLVLVPSEWVHGPLKEYHWRTLIAARAIENTIYLAAADHTPPVGVGDSMIVDPMGAVLASAAEVQDVAVATIDRGRVASVRRVNPALELRRFAVIPREH